MRIVIAIFILLFPIFSFAGDFFISGEVVDRNRRALNSVIVGYKNSETMTDKSGHYKLHIKTTENKIRIDFYKYGYMKQSQIILVNKVNIETSAVMLIKEPVKEKK